MKLNAPGDTQHMKKGVKKSRREGGSLSSIFLMSETRRGKKSIATTSHYRQSL